MGNKYQSRGVVTTNDPLFERHRDVASAPPSQVATSRHGSEGLMRTETCIGRRGRLESLPPAMRGYSLNRANGQRSTSDLARIRRGHVYCKHQVVIRRADV